MSKSLTDGQRLAYLKSPVHCPYCDSQDIAGEVTTNDYDGNYRQRINCQVCGKSWMDVFTLTAVEEEAEEGDVHASPAQ